MPWILVQNGGFGKMEEGQDKKQERKQEDDEDFFDEEAQEKVKEQLRDLGYL